MRRIMDYTYFGDAEYGLAELEKAVSCLLNLLVLRATG
jgi:hypothetical protein